MKKEILQSNLSFISPKIKEQLFSIKEPEILEFVLSKDQFKIPVYQKCLLHSKYDPIGEIKRLQLDLECPNQINIALGFGAGYHLKEISNKQTIIVIPVHIPLLYSILSEIKLDQLFKKKSLYIIDSSEITEYLKIHKKNNIQYIIHPVLQRLFTTQIIDLQRDIQELLSTHFLEENTILAMSEIWIKNFLKNLYSYANKLYNNSPLNIQNKPIMITGAGPSLEQNIIQLSKFRNRFYLAASDTSFPILQEYQIMPDSVFSFDASPYSLYHFTNQKGDMKNIRFFIDSISPLYNLEINKTLVFSNHPLNQFYSFLGFQAVNLSSFSRNIGGAMIDFFQTYFSRLPIITVGIDFSAYKYFNYSKYSYQHEYKIINSNYFQTENNYDTKLFYHSNYINSVEHWKTTHLFNHYQKDTNAKNIFTLSNSPFVNFSKITNLEDFLNNIMIDQNITLSFHYPEIKVNEIYNYWNHFIKLEFLNKNKFLSKTEEKISILIEQIFNR